MSTAATARVTDMHPDMHPDLLPPFAFLGHATELAKARWEPKHGVVIESLTLASAGIHRLASKHERVAFGVQRAA